MVNLLICAYDLFHVIASQHCLTGALVLMSGSLTPLITLANKVNLRVEVKKVLDERSVYVKASEWERQRPKDNQRENVDLCGHADIPTVFQRTHHSTPTPTTLEQASFLTRRMNERKEKNQSTYCVSLSSCFCAFYCLLIEQSFWMNQLLNVRSSVRS